MFCGYCGKQIDDNIKYCPYCGKPVLTFSEDIADMDTKDNSYAEEVEPEEDNIFVGKNENVSSVIQNKSKNSGVIYAAIAVLAVFIVILLFPKNSDSINNLQTNGSYMTEEQRHVTMYTGATYIVPVGFSYSYDNGNGKTYYNADLDIWLTVSIEGSNLNFDSLKEIYNDCQAFYSYTSLNSSFVIRSAIFNYEGQGEYVEYERYILDNAGYIYNISLRYSNNNRDVKDRIVEEVVYNFVC